jgi:hypothetical protein
MARAAAPTMPSSDYDSPTSNCGGSRGRVRSRKLRWSATRLGGERTKFRREGLCHCVRVSQLTVNRSETGYGRGSGPAGRRCRVVVVALASRRLTEPVLRLLGRNDFLRAVRLATSIALLCPIDQLAQLVNWPKIYDRYINFGSLINWAAIGQFPLMYWNLVIL